MFKITLFKQKHIYIAYNLQRYKIIYNKFHLKKSSVVLTYNFKFNIIKYDLKKHLHKLLHILKSKLIVILAR